MEPPKSRKADCRWASKYHPAAFTSGRLQSLRQKNDPASLSEKRTASGHAYLLYRLSPSAAAWIQVEQAILHGCRSFKKLQSKSRCCPIQIRYTYQIPGGGCTETPECSQSSELPETRQYELLEQGNYTMDVFLERSEALAQQSRPPPLPLFLKLRKI